MQIVKREVLHAAMVAVTLLQSLQYAFAASAVSERTGPAYSEPIERKVGIMNTADQNENYNRMKDRAKQHALQLRREAMDSFWRGVGDAFARMAVTACYGAQRRMQQLARRAQQRAHEIDSKVQPSEGNESCRLWN